jgi:hypothetical protein
MLIQAAAQASMRQLLVGNVSDFGLRAIGIRAVENICPPVLRQRERNEMKNKSQMNGRNLSAYI